MQQSKNLDRLRFLQIDDEVSRTLYHDSIDCRAPAAVAQMINPGIWEILREIVREFIIPATGSEAAHAAFQYLSGDYEDAMQIAAAVAGKADCMVTRDQRGFAKCPIPVFSATECVAQMTSTK